MIGLAAISNPPTTKLPPRGFLLTWADPRQLLPGDHILYGNSSLADRVIMIKTWSDVGHLEIFAGEPFHKGDYFSRGARATGVNLYPFRSEGIRYILRPQIWNEPEAVKYFQHAQGQKYDWLGLFCFALAVRQGSPDRQFCSEYGRNEDRAAGCPSFAADWPGDKTAPGNYLMSPAFTKIFDYSEGK